MSTGRPSTEQEAPFGYYFEIPGVDAQHPYPPPGPPLLDNTETSLLQNFFDNPHNLDPSFLLDSSDQVDGLSSFSNNNINWLENGLTNAPSGSASQAQFPSVLPQTNSNRSPVGARSALNAPEDVYAAAQVLHNKQTSRSNNAGIQFSGYSGSRGNANGYGYGHMTSSTNTPYNFGHQGQGEGTYPRQNLPYGPAEDFSPYSQTFNQDGNPYSAPEAPMGVLKFGSDDNFRNENYVGPKIEPPDKTLSEMGQSGIDYAVKEIVTQFRQASSSAKKRGKAAAEAEGSEGEPSDDEGSTPPKRRRKGKDGDDGEYNESGSRSANGKSRHGLQGGRGRVQRTSSTKNNSKTSPSGSRQPKENLTEEQKRSNHIHSEQKRRNLIKNGFEDLNNLVPELRAGGYSKSNMLTETAKFIRLLQDGNEDLRRQIQSLDNG